MTTKIISEVEEMEDTKTMDVMAERATEEADMMKNLEVIKLR